MIRTNTSPIRHLPFTIKATDGEILYCDARFPAEEAGPFPVVVFAHGFKGFMGWGCFPYVCAQLAARGFYVLSFNFSHNGTAGHGEEFTQLEKFAANTFTRELRELGEVIDAVTAREIPQEERSSPGRIGLLGHSRGGGIALLHTSRDSRIRGVCTWGAVSTFHRYTPRQLANWRGAGYLEQPNARTGQMMRLNTTLLDDLETNTAELDIIAAVGRIRVPLLLLHGEQDVSVTVDNGIRLAEAANPDILQFERVPRGSHTFGAVHPFAGTTEPLEYALRRTGDFFATHLR